METASLGPSLLWLLVLLFPALLVTALCLCCRDLPGPNSEGPSVDGPQQPGGGLVILKPRYCNWPPAVPCQPDLLPIPRSPQPPEPSRRIPSRRDVDTRSEPSYENEEPEDADEEDDYHNEGYLIVLPDGSSSEPLSNSAPNLVSPDLRESPSSTVWGEDYVNVSASESTEVSLGGSCEYVNVPEAQEKRTPASQTPVTDRDGEEEGPDYENVQEQNGHSFT
ncbi:linker for activation of T-cells family member 1 [Sminthopsis crassicaudata]|uniref:linker for activation of T-cells family member 1 n=1 Tax=Sminthopsis crassicaudata TaxID=9301 RepID=UPI003D683F91